MKKVVETDIAILGGGVAGLWTLNRLRQKGYSAILLESATLGGGQTGKAQGIIHGGMKYALQGILTPAAQTVSAMPARWQQCLQGDGEINLSNVPILSEQQYLWSTGSLTSKLAGFFAGIALRSHMNLLDKAAYPEIFQHPEFQGQVYALAEMSIDVHALVRELMKPHQDAIFKIDPMSADQLQLSEEDELIELKINAAPMPELQVKAQRYIFAAGNGNELLLQKLHNKRVKMQRRPLHMAVVKHDYAYPVYAHCLGLGTTPRMTITSHRAHDGKPVWYLGGQFAEEGVKRNPDEQIAFARQELTNLFPWLDFSRAEWASFFIDRAEPLQSDGGRPDSCYVQDIQNMIIAWPTKMALAPLLADQIMQRLQETGIQPSAADVRELRAWPIPALALPIWDQLL